MRLFTRLILVIPLALATCGAALLNGNVLCIDGVDHVALEAEHGPAGCPEAGHEEPDADGGHCTDVSADFHLLRAGERSSVDTTSVELPNFLAFEPSVTRVSVVGAAAVDRAAESPPSAAHTAVLKSVVLLN